MQLIQVVTSSYPLKGDPLENFTIIDFLKELKSRGMESLTQTSRPT